MAKRLTAEVYMQLSVSVHVGGWEASASFEELREQAEREARASLGHHLKNSNIKLHGYRLGCGFC
ncbi:hypothetical protein [Rahnella sp. ChDrAdgB13]|uniref:hypothetical protein n=1 Tax=Rahnella sp. ChDrAdgB13 TaxID=1850581 RepID=UPI001AD8828E|nr:hypothetical protein [Rahnella sp. ChDrAdgB13]